jgi:hypothetical protein
MDSEDETENETDISGGASESDILPEVPFQQFRIIIVVAVMLNLVALHHTPATRV